MPTLKLNVHQRDEVKSRTKAYKLTDNAGLFSPACYLKEFVSKVSV